MYKNYQIWLYIEQYNKPSDSFYILEIFHRSMNYILHVKELN